MKLELKKVIPVVLIVMTAVDMVVRRKWWTGTLSLVKKMSWWKALSHVSEKNWWKEKVSGLKYSFHMN